MEGVISVGEEVETGALSSINPWELVLESTRSYDDQISLGARAIQ